MGAYDLFLLLIKIAIIGSMFYVLRNYGIKALITFSVVLLVVFLIVMYIISYNRDKSNNNPTPKEISTQKNVIEPKIQDKINQLKESIAQGEERNICYLGREYDHLNMLQEAFEAFSIGVSKEFNECKTDLGMYYFNGRFVPKDWDKAGQLWTEAYNDDKFDETTNYNMAVYAINVYNDKQKYKYHLLKTTLIDKNDEEAKMYLDNKLLKGISASALFLKEAVGEHYYTPQMKGNKFSYGFELYYRFKKMFNKDEVWMEDYNYNQEDTIRYTNKKEDSLIFTLKNLMFQAKLETTKNKEETDYIIENMGLLNDILFVDRSDLKQINAFIEQTKSKLAQNKSFKQTKELSFFRNYHFVYSAVYNKEEGTFSYEIQIKDKR